MVDSGFSIREEMNMAVNGKIAVVTGAGKGIGRAQAALCFVIRQGFSVALAGCCAVELSGLRLRQGLSGGEMLAAPTDVTSSDSVRALFARVKDMFGRLDVLFNNAGTGAPGVLMEDLTFDQWDERGGERELDGVVPVRPGSDQNHEGAGAARRAHHQQRLDFGACPTASLGSLYGDEARHHGADEMHFASSGLPQVIHCVWANSTSVTRLRRATERMKAGVPQPDGSKMVEPRMDVRHVADAVVYMAGLPLDANVQFMTVMATKMPFVGRG